MRTLTEATNKAAESKISGTGPQVGPTKEAAAAAAPGINSIGKLESIFEGGIQVDSPTLDRGLQIGNELANVGIEQAVQSREGIISTLFQLGSMLVSAIFTSSAKSSGGGIGAAIGGLIGAKDGGVLSGGIRAFADGGYVTKPTLGLVGEGNRNEAVVPLPNNREIPVEMRGSGDTINIEQNFDFTNADNNAVPMLRAEARAIEERTFARVFSEMNRGGRYAKISGRR
jgi:hypothetical protein